MNIDRRSSYLIVLGLDSLKLKSGEQFLAVLPCGHYKSGLRIVMMLRAELNSTGS